MSFKIRAVTLGCMAALGMGFNANSAEVLGKTLEVYGSLYPEINNITYTDAVAGNALSTMSAGKVTPGVSAAKTKVSKDQINWSQSYIGVKGQKSFGDITIGYDFQGVMAPNKTLDSSIENITTGSPKQVQALFGDTRDAFVSIEHKAIGSFQFGQMDTAYKEYGDRVRMLGVSSSNFTSTSGVLSGVGWRASSASDALGAGTTSFNTRVGSQMSWQSPAMGGLQAALSMRQDPNKTALKNQSMQAMALRWTDGTYYVSAQQEVHNDYLAFSGNLLTALSATSVYNLGTARSKDTATRVSFGYKKNALQLAADFATLNYTEASSAAGKFSSYKTNTYQVSADYALSPEWNVAANFANGAAGTCTLLGGAACTTDGQGGSLTSLGTKYNFDKNISLFAMYGLNKSNSSAVFASSNVGGKTTNTAIGVLIKF